MSTKSEIPAYRPLGVGVLDIKNKSGRSAITEAEMNEWAEGVTWMVGVMAVDDARSAAQESDEVVESEDVQVAIQDTAGRVAKLCVKYREAKDIRAGSTISFPPSLH